jgi:hypothetical protein
MNDRGIQPDAQPLIVIKQERHAAINCPIEAVFCGDQFSGSIKSTTFDISITTMSARHALGAIARRRLVPPKPQKTYVKWYMNWADTAHKAVVLTCVGVTRISPSTTPSLTRSLLWRRCSVHVFPKSQKQRRVATKVD